MKLCVFSMVLLAMQVAGAGLVTDIWAGLESHPCEVNPVAYEVFGRPAENISLAGEWEFVMKTHDGGGRSTGLEFSTVTMEEWKDSMKMRVPGCWEAGGAGKPGMSLPNICGDNAPKRLRHIHSGTGFYRKDVTIPAAWKGRRIWLKAGGVLSKGWFFVNGNPVAQLEEYVGAYKWDVTAFVKAGEKARVVALCDNAVASRTGRGELNRWGGLIRDVELEATPYDVWIDDAWVRGDFDARVARVEVKVEKVGGGGEKKVGQESRSTADGLSLRVTVDGAQKESTIHCSPSPSTFTLSVPLRNFHPWAPEHPHLYWAKIELVAADGRVLQTVRERFGVRKLEVVGKEFRLNGRPFFFRGCGDNEPFPITGCSPADRNAHRANFKAMHDAGFNCVRLHTHGELEEYMEAADEVGVMVQPEVPYYNDVPKDDFGYDPIRDANARYVAYRRYVSYAINSQGNEGLLGPGAGKTVYNYLKKLDPDRLVIEQDGGVYMHPDHGEETSDYCMGPLGPWPRGTFNRRAFIAHEYLNLSVRYDPRCEKEYTGLWFPPTTVADRVKWLAKSGLTPEAWGDDLLDAQHVLQSFWQKNGIELARQDPYCDGYCFWTITDSVVWNDAAEAFTAQGLFDPFHRPKRHGFTAKDFAVFNSPSAILLDNEDVVREMKEDTHWRRCCDPGWKPNREGLKRVYVSGETIPATFIFAHYGEEDLADAEFAWEVRSGKEEGRGEEVKLGGRVKVGAWKAGPAREVAKCPIAVPELTRPVKVALTATIFSKSDNQAIKQSNNSWDFWLFPRSKRPARRAGPTGSDASAAIAAPENVAVVKFGSDEERAALESGRHVVSLANQETEPNYLIGWWWIGDQTGMVFREHPMLKGLPYEKYLTPLYFGIVRKGVQLPIEGFSEKDLVAVGEGAKGCYAYLADRKLPNGKRHILVGGLDVTKPSPVGDALLEGIYSYLR